MVSRCPRTLPRRNTTRPVPALFCDIVSLVCGENDQGVVGHAERVEQIDDAPHAPVQEKEGVAKESSSGLPCRRRRQTGCGSTQVNRGSMCSLSHKSTRAWPR